MIQAYKHLEIEKKWQDFWDKHQTFKTEDSSTKPKYYCLDMFPYPSSQGLHVGHPEGYTASDIIARYKRARGFNVLHPMGWDAFGLPAEQYAIQTGIHPEVTTQSAIQNFKRQLKALGFSFDWSRELSTCNQDYYRFTQAIFIQLYQKGLVYQTEVLVNWCPALKTVLANEEVTDGKSERGSHPVFRVPMKQWMLRITQYAERLLNDLDLVDWPESTKELQRNWIGRSEGTEVVFTIEHSQDTLNAFTTRLETLFGVTFLVVAPEHPFAQNASSLEVQLYLKAVALKSEVNRKENSGKTGVFSGHYASHPLTQERIPIWIADYIFMNYGTGVVMGVPAHDDRDHAFATTHQLAMISVIDENNYLIHSHEWTGLFTEQARLSMETHLIAQHKAKHAIYYKLRDWLFSRQRYWGEPIPIIYQDHKPQCVSSTALPVVLPKVENFQPLSDGQSPLANAETWLYGIGPDGKPFVRETDTMPGSAGSSWYFLRFCDPNNTSAPFSFEAQKYWLPVDLYIGGPEHAVGHLLYARFWTKVLYDLNLVSYSEPFKKLVHQGMILGEDGEKI
jgi:leucyl-tRNA synthetase